MVGEVGPYRMEAVAEHTTRGQEEVGQRMMEAVERCRTEAEAGLRMMKTVQVAQPAERGQEDEGAVQPEEGSLREAVQYVPEEEVVL